MIKPFITLLACLSLTLGATNAFAGGHKNKEAKTDTAASQSGENKGKNSAAANEARGNERSQEMLNRRDERKENQAEDRSDREPGTEGSKGKPEKNAQ